jgi:hypothetical protein
VRDDEAKDGVVVRGGSVRRRRGPDDEVQVCERCGSDATRPADRWEAFRRWFDDGAGAARGWRCRSCGASWWGGSTYLVGVHRSGPARALRVPVDVLDAVRAARSWHPVPRFYAIVGAAALVPAALVAAFTGVGWGAALVGVPAAAIAVVFVWSLATGLGRRARQDVMHRLAPARAMQRETDENVTELGRQLGGFTLLAPAIWDGEITIGGVGWSVPPRGPRQLREVTVTADQGDPLRDPDVHTPGWRPPGPRVEVRVTDEPHGIGDDEVEHDLAARSVHAEVFGADDEDLGPDQGTSRAETERRLLDRHAAFERAVGARTVELASRWRAGHLTVDGADVTARMLEADGLAAARFDLDGRAMLVTAEGIAADGLALRRVGDPTPLIDTYAARHRRMMEGLRG